MGARPNHGCYVIRASPDGLGFRLYWQANPTARDTAFEYGGKERRLFRSIAQAQQFVRQRWGEQAIIDQAEGGLHSAFVNAEVRAAVW
jgi:hypothetical protein